MTAEIEFMKNDIDSLRSSAMQTNKKIEIKRKMGETNLKTFSHLKKSIQKHENKTSK